MCRVFCFLFVVVDMPVFWYLVMLFISEGCTAELVGRVSKLRVRNSESGVKAGGGTCVKKLAVVQFEGLLYFDDSNSCMPWQLLCDILRKEKEEINSPVYLGFTEVRLFVLSFLF